MVDANIKKVVVLNEDLPIINADISGYAVRYRVVSEDKNRVSHWSPTYYIDAGYSYVPGQIHFSKTSAVVSLVWDKVSIQKSGNTIGKIRDYDVWIRWGKTGTGDWIYDGKLSTNTANYVVPSTYTTTDPATGLVTTHNNPNEFSAEIFLEGIPVSRLNTSLKMYTVDRETV